jgi:RNA polymerase sigma-70 factor (ECF subfamily)
VATRATDNVEKQEEIARVLKALEGLPTDQKEVIVLGVFQDLSYAQMEEITGTKAVTLRSRMFHGLKKLASMIGGPPREGRGSSRNGEGAGEADEASDEEL